MKIKKPINDSLEWFGVTAEEVERMEGKPKPKTVEQIKQLLNKNNEQ